jgi:hypothetical protein
MSHTDGARGNELQQLRARLADLEAATSSLPARFQSARPSALFRHVTQASHGLAVGNAIRHNGTAWVKAQADTPANAHAQALVVSVPHPGAIVIALPGSYCFGLSGLTAGLNFVSAITAGLLTTTAPEHMRPCFYALSATTGILLPDGPVYTVSTSDPGSTAATDGDLWFKN